MFPAVVILSQSYSQCDQLLDSDGVCGGVFRPEVVDPEVCHASSALLWEYTILSVSLPTSSLSLSLSLSDSIVPTKTL